MYFLWDQKQQAFRKLFEFPVRNTLEDRFVRKTRKRFQCGQDLRFV